MQNQEHLLSSLPKIIDPPTHVLLIAKFFEKLLDSIGDYREDTNDVVSAAVAFMVVGVIGIASYILYFIFLLLFILFVLFISVKVLIILFKFSINYPLSPVFIVMGLIAFTSYRMLSYYLLKNGSKVTESLTARLLTFIRRL